MKFKRRNLWLIVIVLLYSALAVTSASAHALLLRSNPQANAILAQPPVQIELFFSESVEATLSTIKVFNTGGTEVDVGDVRVDPSDPTRMTVSLHTIGDGIYTVTWKAVSAIDGQPVEDVSNLTVNISYGGQNKTLTLQPLGEETPGQFIAPILPTVAGQYTVKLGGTLGDTAVDADVEPEEVQSADKLQFPSTTSEEQSANLGMMNWLIYLSLLIGLIALVLGVMALRKSR